MAEGSVIVERFDSWKEIASYVNRSVRTVIRWENQKGLPVHRVPGGERQNVFAYRHEIDHWLQSGQIEFSAPEVLATSHTTIDLAAVSIDPSNLPSIRSWRKMIPGWVWVGAVVTVLATGTFALRFLASSRQVQFSEIVQITSDGSLKEGLVTDGKHLYFGERRNGGYVLTEVSVSGGPIRSIPTPLIGGIPEGISADGNKLLVLDHQGEEQERALWIVSVDSGESHRVGEIFCHSAAWSPNGQRIAYANGSDLYLFENGAARRIITAPGIPRFLRWTRDGSGLRFDVQDVAIGQSALWEMTFTGPDATQVASSAPLRFASDHDFRSLAILDDAEHYFLTVNGPLQNRIWLLEKSWGLSGSHYGLVKLNAQLTGISRLALDRTGRRLFALSGMYAGDDLVRFNPATQDFKPFLPGIAAKDVDFSRDGRRIAYVSSDGTSLWISRSNGADRHEVDFRPLDVELPHWSPDGRWIAFMARLPKRPWRIFIVSSEGGPPREASTGSDNQGAGTWSPDSRSLMYGNVDCQESATCAIHEIDLATGNVSQVSGSEGMGTARWSPDGRFVAALLPIRQEVYLFEVGSRRWRKLADTVNGNDLSWSADSRYVYASRPNGSKPDVLRIAVADGAMTSAVDLSDFSKLPGRVDTWFGLAPDGSIIFLRSLEESEIYSFRY